MLYLFQIFHKGLRLHPIQEVCRLIQLFRWAGPFLDLAADRKI